MSETIKTLGFVVVAGALGLTAWIVAPRTITEVSQVGMVGKPLFPSFSDPTAAKKMEIIRFDEKLAAIIPFVVEYRNGAWRLPSRSDYPADAEAQMSKAANLLIGMEVLSDVTDRSSFHATYGVLDPNSKDLKAGATGVGKRVNLYDGTGNKLAEVIVGDEMKDRPGIYYVRHGGPGRNQVYSVKMDAKLLTTNFEDWIEKDLLKLDAFAIKELELKDYVSQGGVQDNQLVASVANRSQSLVSYDSKKGEWSLKALQKFDEASTKWVEDPIQEGEEIDTQVLNDVRYALDDLKIVDVVRKPAKLGADLRADKALMNDLETVSDLLSRGFMPYVDPNAPDQTEILSENGEFVCRMNNGVEYVLRFGKTANLVIAEEKPAAEGEEKGENRYLMVAARFNADMIDKPELEPVPQTIEDLNPKPPVPPAAQSSTSGQSAAAVASPTSETSAAAPETAPAAFAGDGAAPAAQTPAEDPSASTRGAEASQASPSSEGEAPATDAAPAGPSLEAPAGTETPQGSESPQGTETAPSASGQPSLQNSPQEPAAATAQASPPKAEESASTSSKADSVTSAAGEPTAQAPASAPIATVEQAKLIAAQEKVAKANAEKQKDYETKLKEGEAKVKELNDRFADWYYVISDSVYKKIRLGRADIIKTKQAEEQNPAAPNGLPPGLNIPGLGGS